jgi:hypothetical protein
MDGILPAIHPAVMASSGLAFFFFGVDDMLNEEQ